jgi:hypothetical protein
VRLLDVFRLRPLIGLHRELRRLNDNVEAVMLHLSILSKRDILNAQKAAEDEAKKIDANPALLNVPSAAQQAAEELRERAKRFDVIEPAELLAVAESLQEEEEMEWTEW